MIETRSRATNPDYVYDLQSLLYAVQYRLQRLADRMPGYWSYLREECDTLYGFICQAERIASDLCISIQTEQVLVGITRSLRQAAIVIAAVAHHSRRPGCWGPEDLLIAQRLIGSCAVELEGHCVCFGTDSDCIAPVLGGLQANLRPGYPEMGSYYSMSIDDLLKRAEHLALTLTSRGVASIFVVGIRSSGSFAAPIYVSVLQESIGPHVSYITVRPVTVSRHASRFTLPLRGALDVFTPLSDGPHVEIHPSDMDTIADWLRSSQQKNTEVLVLDDPPCGGDTLASVRDHLESVFRGLTISHECCMDVGRARDERLSRLDSSLTVDSLGVLDLLRESGFPGEGHSLRRAVPIMHSCCHVDRESTCSLCEAIAWERRRRFPCRTWLAEYSSTQLGNELHVQKFFAKHVGIPAVAQMEVSRIEGFGELSPKLLAVRGSLLMFEYLEDCSRLADNSVRLSQRSLETIGVYLAALRLQHAVHHIPLEDMAARSQEAISYLCTWLGLGEIEHRAREGVSRCADRSVSSGFHATNLGGGVSPAHWLSTDKGTRVLRCHLDSGNDPCIADISEEILLLRDIMLPADFAQALQLYEQLTQDSGWRQRALLLTPIFALRLHEAELAACRHASFPLARYCRHAVRLSHSLARRITGWLEEVAWG